MSFSTLPPPNSPSPPKKNLEFDEKFAMGIKYASLFF